MLDFRHTDTDVNRFTENISRDHPDMRTPIPPKFETFEERVKWWAEERGYSKRGRQGDLARVIGLSQASTWAIVHGKTPKPTAQAFLKLCDALKLRPQYLLFGQGPPEGQYLNDLDSQEAQLIELFRRLPSEGMRHAVLIDTDRMLQGAAGEKKTSAGQADAALISETTVGLEREPQGGKSAKGKRRKDPK